MEFRKLHDSETNNSVNKWAKVRYRDFLKAEIQMAKRHL